MLHRCTHLTYAAVVMNRYFNSNNKSGAPPSSSDTMSVQFSFTCVVVVSL